MRQRGKAVRIPGIASRGEIPLDVRGANRVGGFGDARVDGGARRRHFRRGGVRGGVRGARGDARRLERRRARR